MEEVCRVVFYLKVAFLQACQQVVSVASIFSNVIIAESGGQAHVYRQLGLAHVLSIFSSGLLWGGIWCLF